MTSKLYPNLRRTEQRQNQIELIKQATGIEGFASTIDYALARAIVEIEKNRVRVAIQRETSA